MDVPATKGNTKPLAAAPQQQLMLRATNTDMGVLCPPAHVHVHRQPNNSSVQSATDSDGPVISVQRAGFDDGHQPQTTQAESSPENISNAGTIEAPLAIAVSSRDCPGISAAKIGISIDTTSPMPQLKPIPHTNMVVNLLHVDEPAARS